MNNSECYDKFHMYQKQAKKTCLLAPHSWLDDFPTPCMRKRVPARISIAIRALGLTQTSSFRKAFGLPSPKFRGSTTRQL